jgi:outer membrane protein OmpA-like peptidoglycan-associated protein
MNKYLSTIMLSLLTLTTISCAQKNMALQDARSAFQNASNDPTVQKNAPVALHDAGLALKEANEAEAKGADKDEVSHLSSLAMKRVEIAKIEAQKKAQDSQLQEISKTRTDAVLTAREQEAKAAREKASMMEASNKQLETAATQSQAEKDALALKNETLEKELAALKMKPTARGMELTLKDTVFEFGKADLTSGARRDLEKLSQELKNAPDRKILVEGHTDGIGTDEFNQALSERRAQAIKDALARDIDSSRITARGLGKQYPVASNNTEAGRQQNRRVTVTVLSAEQGSAPTAQ